MQENNDTVVEYFSTVDPPPTHIKHFGRSYTCTSLTLDESLSKDEKPEPKPAMKEPQPYYNESRYPPSTVT